MSTFYRASYVSICFGALSLGLGYLLRADIKQEHIDDFTTPKAFVSTALVAIGTLALLCGLPALFAKQAGKVGKSGLFASALTFAGIAAFHLGTLALYLVLPVLITHNTATRSLVDADEPPFPLFAIFWSLSLLLQSAGLLWLGIKTWMAAYYSRIGSALLILGGCTFIAAPAFSFSLIKPANTIVMIGFLICSQRLLSTTTRKMPGATAPLIATAPL